MWTLATNTSTTLWPSSTWSTRRSSPRCRTWHDGSARISLHRPRPQVTKTALYAVDKYADPDPRCLKSHANLNFNTKLIWIRIRSSWIRVRIQKNCWIRIRKKLCGSTALPVTSTVQLIPSTSIKIGKFGSPKVKLTWIQILPSKARYRIPYSIPVIKNIITSLSATGYLEKNRKIKHMHILC